MRYFIELAYHGKNYSGWQKQPNAISVQEVVEKTLSTLLREEISVVAAGRTDAGVHAKQLFVHVEMNPIADISEFIYRINSFLPVDISVNQICKVTEDAHARFHALKRTYEYHIITHKSPFYHEFAYKVSLIPDIERMNKAANILFEYSNFKCFSRTKSDVKTYECVIKDAKWEQKEDLLTFTIAADRFLRNMVRAIVGTLLDVGYGKTSLEEFHSIIQSQDRKNAGASVPAHGLYLTEISYPEHLFINE